ncbi:MAG: endonuclease domain-containing protein [Propionicimonas sp.]
MNSTIERILAENGAITTAANPRLKSALLRLKRDGVLANPLPGVFTVRGENSALGWLRAVSAWSDPAGVLHDRSAASIWLPDLAGTVALLAHPSLRSRRGVVVCRRRIPPEFVLVSGGIRVASPAYAAVELAATDDGRAICEALRLRRAGRAGLTDALAGLAGTPGNQRRQKVVAACAHNPWSYAELRLHRILVDAGITGWVGNRPLVVGGLTVFPDVRFLAKRLILEFDGRTTHLAGSSFLSDRERQNTLEAAGYHVLRFGWEHLDQPDYVVPLVRTAFRAAPEVTR